MPRGALDLDAELARLMRLSLRTFAQGRWSARNRANADLDAPDSRNPQHDVRDRGRAQNAFKEQEAMKSLRTISFVALLAIMVASVAHAAPTVNARIGDGHWDVAQVHPNTQHDLHIILTGVEDSINAIEYKVNLPQDVAVLSNTYGFPGALDFGGANGNAIGFGQCVPLFQVSQGADDLVVHTIRIYALGSFASSPITLTAFEGGTDNPTTPRYATCNGTTVDLSVSGAMLESTTGVPSDSNSWGAVKAMY